MAIKSFRDLEEWHLSMQLVEDIYPLVRMLNGLIHSLDRHHFDEI